MELTKNEQENLKLLIKHPGFEVVEKIASDLEMSVLRGIKNINVSDNKELALLSAKQNYLRGCEYLMSCIKGKSQTISKKEV